MDGHTVIGLGARNGESEAHCSCGWSIEGSAGAVGRALGSHLDHERTNAWCRMAALPFTGRTS